MGGGYVPASDSLLCSRIVPVCARLFLYYVVASVYISASRTPSNSH